MTFKQHPLSAAFPSMSSDDFAALVEDVRANGQREPVIVLDDMVLDGWHRYSACLQLDIKPAHFTFAGADPVAFVLSQNLHRRHLSASQRAAAVVACNEWAPARRPNKVEPGSTLSQTNAQMAKVAHVTPRTITDAKAAHKAGLTPAIKDGALTVKEAAKVVRGGIKQKPAEPPPAPPAALSEAREAVGILTEENDRLNDRLAVDAMDATEEEKALCSETIANLRALNKTLTAELKAVKASRDEYMRENGELKKQIKSQRAQLDKLKA